MGQRIQRQPSSLSRRRITQFVRDPAMRDFMKGQSETESRRK
jgi:hypothetical protein